jgi:hypothetical protein
MQPEVSDLKDFLSRLHQTADAKNAQSRPNLQARIEAFLHQMQSNHQGFRAIALDRVSQGLVSCHDRVIGVMNDLEQLVRIQEARTSESPATALRLLAKGLLALEVVHRHAAAKCESMGRVNPALVDLIEVYLAFEIKLKDDLGLPVSTENMLFERCASLTDDDINNAKQAAIIEMTDEANITHYLSQWEPWQQFERSEQAQQLMWRNLPTTEHAFQRDDCCLISSSELKEMTAPVCVGDTLYDLDALLKHWIDKGTDPANNLKMTLDQLSKVDHLISNERSELALNPAIQ